MLARDRILSARGLDDIVRRRSEAEARMGSDDEVVRDKAMRAYTRLETEFEAQGGYAAESEAASIASALNLEERILGQPLGTLSGGQRRRVELSRILFSGNETLLLDEPTNHLDADSIIWLREYLRAYKGGLIIISHDAEMLDAVVNKVYHLDANRSALDVYNVNWKTYLQARETDEKRRRRELQNAQKKAGALMAQADKMRAKATKATAAQNMAKRAERLLAGVEGERVQDKVAKLRFPSRLPVARRPCVRRGSPARTARSRSSPTSTSPSTAAARSSCSASTVRQDDAAADARRRRHPRHRRGRARSRAAPRLLRPGAREPRRRSPRSSRT